MAKRLKHKKDICQSAGSPVRVIIVDDHAIVRKGMRQILSDIPDIVVADEANNGAELLSKVQNNNYDLALLDLSMPGMNGIVALKLLKQARPEIKVLILTMHAEEQYALIAMSEGADGYVTKESVSDELVTAIKRVIKGKNYLNHSIASRLALNYGKGVKPLHELLSSREQEVLCMIAAGRRIKEIAAGLSLSAKTVSTYRSRILEKMGMKNNAELVRYAIENKLPCEIYRSDNRCGLKE